VAAVATGHGGYGCVSYGAPSNEETSCSLAVATIARWWMGWLDDYRGNPPRGRGGYGGGGYARAVATESLVSEKKDKQGLLVGLRLYGFRIRSLICSKT
jgi:hypothetical protein